MNERAQHDRTITEYFEILRRRKWILLLTVVIAPAVAVSIARSQPKLFTATTDVLLTGSATGAQSPLGGDATSLLQTQEEVAASPGVAGRVVLQTGIRSRSVATVQDEASFAGVGSADVLRIGITDRNPSVAVTLANAYATQYIQYKRELETGFLKRTQGEIEVRMDALRAKGQERSALYAVLAQEDQSLVQAQALQTQSAVVLRRATGAGQIQPRPTRDGVLGLIVGIMLGLAFALLWDAIDPRIRNSQALAEALGLPVLASLATPPRKLRRKRRLVMLENAGEPQADALRILATNLEFANVDRRFKAIMLTSPTGGEGKSTSAANLAVALARTGKRVVLVDLDLHRPVIEKFFDLEGRPGLTSVAIGRVPLEEALVRVVLTDRTPAAAPANGGNGDNGHRNDVAMLEVLPAGPLPPNPGEFVASLAVRSILDALRGRADVVIVDSPPLLEMSDALALSAAVDGIILVARLKSARRPLLRQTRQILDTTPAAKLGVVLTGAEREHGYWYARYGSYYPRTAPPYPPTRAPQTVARDR